MTAHAIVPATSGLHPAQPTETADHVAERHLVRRMIMWSALLMPAGALFFGTLVALAVVPTGTAIAGPIAMGAGTGLLAGLFFGTWAGFVASVSEFEDLEHQ